MTKTFKYVYVVKYALTTGIFKLREANRFNVDVGVWRGKGHSRAYLDREVAFTEDEALQKADEMRRKKIELLKKQIARLEKMEFEVKE